MNIVHIAWLGGHNFGDDLMADMVWGELRKHDPDLHVTVWSHDKPFPREGMTWIYRNIPRIGFLRRIVEKRALKKADMLLGGGTVLHSMNSISWKYEAVKLFKQLHPDRAAIGVCLSAGPFKGKAEEDECGKLFRLFDALAVRDRPSYEFAKSQGLTYEPVEARDLSGAFLKDVGILPRERITEIQRVGLMFNLPKAIDEARLTEVYAGVLKRLVSDGKEVLVFGASCPPNNEDRRYIERLLAKSGVKERITTIVYNHDPVAFTKKIRECDYIVSSRLHGLVLGYFLNIPVSFISYRKKFEDFADSVGIPKGKRFVEATATTEELYRSVGVYPHKGIDEEVVRSYRNFEVLRPELWKVKA